MFGKWLKDLWKETWARSLFLLGFASNVITFFFPGLQSPVLRSIPIALLVAGFLWANFSVYKKQRLAINRAETEIADKNDALRDRTFQISLTSEGGPPTKAIKVRASEVVTVSRLGYSLSDDTCIVAEDLALTGDEIEVPLNITNLSKVFNIRRPDMSTWDGSGPMKFALTVAIGGITRTFVLPARIENVVGAGYWIRGSADFGKASRESAIPCAVRSEQHAPDDSDD